jgi:ribosomal protein RSM22 (predicted rRNA methylase)
LQRDHNWGDPFLLAYKLQKQNINEMSSLGNGRGKKEKKKSRKKHSRKKKELKRME